jgi:hypothetical protein
MTQTERDLEEEPECNTVHAPAYRNGVEPWQPDEIARRQTIDSLHYFLKFNNYVVGTIVLEKNATVCASVC